MINYFIILNGFLNLIKFIQVYLGIGDWGLGIGPNPQSPIPKTNEQ